MKTMPLLDAIGSYTTCISEAVDNIKQIAKDADPNTAQQLKLVAGLMRTTLVEIVPNVNSHFTPWQRMALQKIMADKLEAVRKEKSDPNLTIEENMQWLRDWEQLDEALQKMLIEDMK